MSDLCTFDSTLTTFDSTVRTFDQTTCQAASVSVARGAGSGGHKRERKKRLDWSLEEILAYIDGVNGRISRPELPPKEGAAPEFVQDEIPVTPKIKALLSRAVELRDEQNFRDSERRLALLQSIADRLDRAIEVENARREKARLQAEEDEAMEVLLMMH